jgi:hypothetical protein
VPDMFYYFWHKNHFEETQTISSQKSQTILVPDMFYCFWHKKHFE